MGYGTSRTYNLSLKIDPPRHIVSSETREVEYVTDLPPAVPGTTI